MSRAHFIVFVPGFMGSKLKDRKTDKLVWLNLKSIPPNPLKWKTWIEDLFSTLSYPNDDLVPDGILDEVLFIPPWGKFEQYGRLVDALVDWGYEVDPVNPSASTAALYTFAYDWRQDNRISASHLSQSIDQWRTNHPDAKVWIIAHSNGGLVSRWYIEKLGGKDYVERLFLVASPWDGAPNALRVLFSGLETLFRKRFSKLLNIPAVSRKAARTFPCAYQLLPYQNPFLRDLDNEPVDIFQGDDWLEDSHQRELLLDGRRFNKELGESASAEETICLFGRKKATNASGTLTREAGQKWKSIQWQATESGDGTVPERSAIHRNADPKLPFVASHGDIYAISPLLEILEWEIVGKFRPAEMATLVTDEQIIVFETESDSYEPGDQVNLWATIRDKSGEAYISGALATATLEWVQPLPASETLSSSDDFPIIRLLENESTPGRYEGSLKTPMEEGYYRIRAKIKPPGGSFFELEELILVESLLD